MKQKELSRWMKVIVVLGFICVLFLDAVWVPELGRDIAWNTPNLEPMFWPCLIYFWISTIPVMVFMALVWQMATEIGRDNSFCMKNALRLRTCSLLAAADTVYYIIGGVVLLSMNLLHIGIAIIGLGLAAALLGFPRLGAVGAAISVLCAALSHLTRKAADMRSENDLTI